MNEILNSVDVHYEIIYRELKRRTLEVVRVTDFEKGYVSIPFINQRIDTRLQGYAAELTAHHYRKSGIEIDAVAGIPSLGVPFGTAVAERLGVDLIPARKDPQIPGAWKSPIVVSEQVRSFTTTVDYQFTLNGEEPIESILLVDDFCAHGNTALAIGRELQRRGKKIHLAFYCAKLFQPGVERIRTELGVEAFCVIGISEILDDPKQPIRLV